RRVPHSRVGSEEKAMKRFALLLFLSLFVSGMALSDGKSRAVSQIPFNWTVHNDPSSYPWSCAASGLACVSDGIAATWTPPSRIKVTRIEYQSTLPISQLSGTGGPCPVTPTIQVTDGTVSAVLNVANDGSTLYSNSGRISSTFAAGVKLSVE